MGVALTSYKVEAEFSGVGAGWTDITGDLRAGGNQLEWSYGIRGSGPADRMAETGVLQFVLHNVTPGGLPGYYSPNSANKRTGFGLGIRVRVQHTYSGTTYWKFIGSIDRIVPGPGKTPKTSLIFVVDWLDEAARYLIKGVPSTLSTDADAVLTAILAAVPKQPNATSFGNGSDTYAFAPAAGAQASFTFVAEAQRVVMSELGLLTMRGGTSAGAASTLTFLSRAQLVTSPYNASQATLNDTMLGMNSNVSRESVLNVFRGAAHPRSFDPLTSDAVVLYRYQGEAVPIDNGSTYTLLAKYVDPAQRASRVSGYGMLTPVNLTDIVLNSNSSGTGTDLYASFTVTANLGSEGAEFVLTNNSGATGYLVSLQARGYGIYDYEQVGVEIRDAASVTAYGENPVDLDFFYQSDPTFAKNALAYLLPYWKDPTTVVTQVTFLANDTDALMTQAMVREPGDVVTIQETTTGVNKLFRIVGVSYSQREKLVRCTWTLNPMVDVTDYWILEEGGSALGTNTVLAL